MTADGQDLWDEAVRQHDRKVVLSLLAMGLAPDRAREIAQATWAKLIEKHAHGELAEIKLPGLALQQARFLALHAIERDRNESRALHAVPQPEQEPDAERVAIGREQLARALDALAGCNPVARRVFRLIYTDPAASHADVARDVGLSVQRVRQILCETRKLIRAAIEGA